MNELGVGRDAAATVGTILLAGRRRSDYFIGSWRILPQLLQ
jgi:hypothetical protein